LVKLLYPDGSPTNAISNISEKILPGQIVPGIVSPGGILTTPGRTANADSIGTQDTLQPRRLEDASGPIVKPTVGEFKGQVWTYPDKVTKELPRGLIFSLDSNNFYLGHDAQNFDRTIEQFIRLFGYRKIFLNVHFSYYLPDEDAIDYLRSRGINVIRKSQYEVSRDAVLVVALRPPNRTFSMPEFEVFRKQLKVGLVWVLGEHPGWFDYNLRLLDGLGVPTRIRPSQYESSSGNYKLTIKYEKKIIETFGSRNASWVGLDEKYVLAIDPKGAPVMFYMPKIPKV
jgi:hypothetical protein